MTDAQTPPPPAEAIAEVVEWLLASHDANPNPTNRFYTKLVVDLLTRTGGVVPALDLAGYWLRSHDADDYRVMFRWGLNDGGYQLEGVVVHRPDGEALRTSDLRKLPWRTLINEDVEDRIADAQRVAGLGEIVSEYGTPHAKERWIDDGHDEANTAHTEALTTSPRRRYDNDHYVEVARLYDEAVGLGSRAPNRYIANRFNVESTSTVKNWVVECRRRGLLPPTQERKLRGNT